MSEAMEALERAEKVEHSGHGGHHGSSKLIGLTMGLIGVLIALCAALVGGERNEMSRVMIEQTQATADATSASTKFRIVLIDIEHLRAQPLDTIPAKVKERFVRLYSDYLQERKITAAWAASYQPLVDAHFEAAEGFEHAQLIAEVAIVFASLAVLMSSRPAWLLSIVLAIGAMGQAGRVYVQTENHIGPVLGLVEHHREAYEELRRLHVADHSDGDAADALDPGGVIRKEIDEAAKIELAKPHEGAAPAHGEHH